MRSVQASAVQGRSSLAESLRSSSSWLTFTFSDFTSMRFTCNQLELSGNETARPRSGRTRPFRGVDSRAAESRRAEAVTYQDGVPATPGHGEDGATEDNVVSVSTLDGVKIVKASGFSHPSIFLFSLIMLKSKYPAHHTPISHNYTHSFPLTPPPSAMLAAQVHARSYSPASGLKAMATSLTSNSLLARCLIAIPICESFCKGVSQAPEQAKPQTSRH